MNTPLSLKQRLRRRERVFGAWTSIGHPSITEIFARAKVDFVGIDIEHSTIDQEQSQRIIAAAHAGGVACLPRIASHNPEMIKRLLDSGADGIIAPMVSTPEEVERLIAWCKYPPLGVRSFGIARAQGYGFDFARYTDAWNTNSILIIQVESITGVENIERLLSYDAVDGVMIGPYDLSGTLGIPGQLEHPLVVEASRRVEVACRKYGRALGTQLIDPSEATCGQSFAAGNTFTVLASDVFLLWKWADRMGQLIEQQRERDTACRSA